MTKNTDMGNKISKTLDAVFARVTFDLTKADIRQSYKDRIALEILREDGTMAYRALVSKLKDWGVVSGAASDREPHQDAAARRGGRSRGVPEAIPPKVARREQDGAQRLDGARAARYHGRHHDRHVADTRAIRYHGADNSVGHDRIDRSAATCNRR